MKKNTKLLLHIKFTIFCCPAFIQPFSFYIFLLCPTLIRYKYANNLSLVLYATISAAKRTLECTFLHIGVSIDTNQHKPLFIQNNIVIKVDKKVMRIVKGS